MTSKLSLIMHCTGPALLPQGQSQQYQAGQNYQQRYISNLTCSFSNACLLRWLPTGSTNGDDYGIINASGVGFNNFNVVFRSSVLDRTQQSAQSFLAGVFPALAARAQQYLVGASSYLPTGQPVIPVYTTAGIDRNDITIRAYSKCNTFDGILTTWYSSPEFLSKAKETLSFRNSILQAYLDQNITAPDTSLTNWYNIWDSFNVYRSYQVGDIVPSINSTHYSQMQDLAYWLEVSKMRSSLAGNLLGGTVLQMALDSMLTAGYSIAGVLNPGASKPSDSFYQLVGLHGHYNTQLGLLAALKLDQHMPAVDAFAGYSPTGSWLSTGSETQIAANITLPPPKLPSAAAILSFELLVPVNVTSAFNQTAPTVSSSPPPAFAVRLVLQDGPGKAYLTLPLPCGSITARSIGGAGSCTLTDLIAMVQSQKMALQPAEWCGACNNQVADLCVASLASNSLDELNTSCRQKYPGWSIAVVAVLSSLLTLALVALAWWCLSRRKERLQKVGQKQEVEMAGNFTAF